MEETHLHWLFWCYRREIETGQFEDVTNIDVIADDFESARGRAETVVPLSLKGTADSGAGYVLRSVSEQSSDCRHA